MRLSVLVEERLDGACPSFEVQILYLATFEVQCDETWPHAGSLGWHEGSIHNTHFERFVPMNFFSDDDPFNLERFVTAQASVFDEVRAELRRGRKTSHWMWFIFPQIRGLGSSPMAQKFAISSTAEALAYLRHPVLGPRLRQCTQLVNDVKDRSLNQIFGSPDDMKFRSCMTLFAHVAPTAGEFNEALNKYCRGESDPKTLQILQETSGRNPSH